MREAKRQIQAYGRIVQPAIYTRKNKFTRGGEWCVEVLVDCSGSMSAGNKMFHARNALATLVYALRGIPNVKYGLYGFTDIGNFEDQGSSVDIEIKRLNERSVRWADIEILEPVAGNADGLNIRSSINRLIKMGKQRKVMIVISDGQPAYGIGDKSGIDDTRDAVKEAEQRDIRVIGIGIPGANEPTMKYIYPEHLMVKNADNIHIHLTELILKALEQKHNISLITSKWEM